jgi:hypothetical protein
LKLLAVGLCEQQGTGRHGSQDATLGCHGRRKMPRHAGVGTALPRAACPNLLCPAIGPEPAARFGGQIHQPCAMGQDTLREAESRWSRNLRSRPARVFSVNARSGPCRRSPTSAP